jgi:hypothetical protein
MPYPFSFSSPEQADPFIMPDSTKKGNQTEDDE